MIQRREKGASELNRAGGKRTDRRDEEKREKEMQGIKTIEPDF
jgi:hypothetical protein